MLWVHFETPNPNLSGLPGEVVKRLEGNYKTQTTHKMGRPTNGYLLVDLREEIYVYAGIFVGVDNEVYLYLNPDILPASQGTYHLRKYSSPASAPIRVYGSGNHIKEALSLVDEYMKHIGIEPPKPYYWRVYNDGVRRNLELREIRGSSNPEDDRLLVSLSAEKIRHGNGSRKHPWYFSVCVEPGIPELKFDHDYYYTIDDVNKKLREAGLPEPSQWLIDAVTV